ncbi:MAG: glutamate decarboxylase [Lentisphaerae bacterium]|nr:glutamate decarboxylase [Lentisphaerota bacterium]MCP4103499.1 glutamate decarboxylase [Lentisphaerota bacterium]
MYNKIKTTKKSEFRPFTSSAYAGRWVTSEVPKDKIPEKSMESRAAYQLVHDEMNLDSNPALNLASFVTTWMEEEAENIIIESLNKNYIDEDEYPQTRAIHDRVIRMTGNLCHSAEAAGTATIGSSEAIMLALLAHKWNWRNKRKAEGKDCSSPNIVFGGDVHSCWEKFALYFDVEMRVIPLYVDKFTINADDVAQYVDENTIAVGTVLGTTFTGQVDDFIGINDFLLTLKKEKGIDIPMHVDAASGGFVAAFGFPDLRWDFRLEQVKSINISNHKFGLVYPGMGTVLFRNESIIPEELVFHINYLGGSMPNYSLNFSKPSSMVLAQYYNFLRLGQAGYTRIIKNILEVAEFVENALIDTGKFKVLTDTKYLPVAAVCMKHENGYDVFKISKRLRQYGWIVPAYTLPKKAEEIAVLRIVVREHFTFDMAENFIEDINKVLENLDREVGNTPEEKSDSPGVC